MNRAHDEGVLDDGGQNGNRLNHEVLIALLLFGLGDSYESYVATALSPSRKVDPKLNDFTLGLTGEERRQHAKGVTTAFASRGPDRER
ncbi:MAG: hypothetical protein M1839_006765 [Geoglossum umbratile]|nr:MAG: hypothetical protein M1839_006765 [Geoglossum umbratile]